MFIIRKGKAYQCGRFQVKGWHGLHLATLQGWGCGGCVPRALPLPGVGALRGGCVGNLGNITTNKQPGKRSDCIATRACCLQKASVSRSRGRRGVRGALTPHGDVLQGSQELAEAFARWSRLVLSAWTPPSPAPPADSVHWGKLPRDRETLTCLRFP